MKQTIEDRSRQQIAAFLPDAIARALTSYHVFTIQDVPTTEAKKFSEHHGACRVAVAHIELLLKLARWADLPDLGADNKNDQMMLAAMMREAEEELRLYQAEGKKA